MAGLYNGECLSWEWFVVSDYSQKGTQSTVHASHLLSTLSTYASVSSS